MADDDQQQNDKQRVKLQEESDKNVAYYETFLGAWVENRMETDKQILTLSSAAIGLLMFFYKDLENPMQFSIWLIAGILFILSIVLVLCIFQSNSSFIECLIKEDNQVLQDTLEKKLQLLTAWAFRLFLLGVLSSFVLAIIRSDFVLIKLHGGQ
ncbi:MAG: hypothetical protein PHS57_00960 [Alphaproteobacteria bacterium]|nr:hypothetical protein [Alphaproteobacteria bacterium]